MCTKDNLVQLLYNINITKDRKLIVWNQDEHRRFSLHFSIDMGIFNWIHTWAAQYNCDDTKLMLAGVVNHVGGEVAIFKTGTVIYNFLIQVDFDKYQKNQKKNDWFFFRERKR